MVAFVAICTTLYLHLSIALVLCGIDFGDWFICVSSLRRLLVTPSTEDTLARNTGVAQNNLDYFQQTEFKGSCGTITGWGTDLDMC